MYTLYSIVTVYDSWALIRYCFFEAVHSQASHHNKQLLTKHTGTAHRPLLLMSAAALQDSPAGDLFMVHEPHFFLVYCKLKREFGIGCVFICTSTWNSKGLHSYFIKNPGCVCNSSLDDHLYPLWVIFIGVTFVTLETEGKDQDHLVLGKLFYVSRLGKPHRHIKWWHLKDVWFIVLRCYEVHEYVSNIYIKKTTQLEFGMVIEERLKVGDRMSAEEKGMTVSRRNQLFKCI